eukprot:TRINITY_DN2998_c0_g3_i1.p1 TRINITY_DN2998_c0_g3~~TRINITY_DN2998_c0_g3_i1.p1  ORF type:complete len:758 (-),score=157.62 TRINITY_DN2998_c0_g3_i1:169-2442(-)
MLTLQLKRTNATDWQKTITGFVKKTYSKEEAEKVKKACEQFHYSRQYVSKCTETTDSSRDLHQTYYNNYSAFIKRFPVGTKQLELPTRWYDSFQTNKYSESSSIYLEKAAILFNLGVIAGSQAVSQPRSNPDALKTASQLFQQAAGYFEEVKQISAAHLGTAITTDLLPSTLDCFINIMLAQAQECFYEKAFMDKMKDSILAKLAMGVKASYQAALLIMEPKLREYFDKGFFTQVQNRANYYTALGHYRLLVSMRAESTTNAIGEQVARLRLIHGLTQECVKVIRLSPGISADISQAQMRLAQEANTLLQSLEKDNSTIYYEAVPEVEKLAPIEAKIMVKAASSAFLAAGVPPTADLFSSLVSLVVQQTVPAYQKEKEEIIKKLIQTAEAADSAYQRRMTEQSLPGCLQAFSAKAEIPSSIADRIIQVNGKHAESVIQDLETTRQQLSREATGILENCRKIMTDESDGDDDARRQYGGRWTRPSSGSLNQSLWKSIQSFEESLAQAARADAALQQTLKKESAQLYCLGKTYEELAAEIPQQAAQSNQDVKSMVRKVEGFLATVDATKASRAGIIQEARQFAEQDDIRTRTELAGLETQEAVIREALLSYEHFRQRIITTETEQNRLFDQIKDVQVVLEAPEYKATLGTSGLVVDRLEKALISFDTIKKKIGQGIQFYLTTQENAQSLQKTIIDWVQARNAERRRLIMQMQGLDGQPSQGPGGWPNPPQDPSYGQNPYYQPYPSHGPPPTNQGYPPPY